MTRTVYSDRANCGRSARAWLKSQGVPEAKAGVHYEVNKLADTGEYQWIDIREGTTEALAKQNDPEAEPVDMAPGMPGDIVGGEIYQPEPEDDGLPRVGDTVAVKGRKASRGKLVAIIQIEAASGAAGRPCTIKTESGRDITAPYGKLVLIERAAKAVEEPKAPAGGETAPEAPAPLTEAQAAALAGAKVPLTPAMLEKAAEADVPAPPPASDDQDTSQGDPGEPDVSQGDDGKWYRQTHLGLLGPFATEDEALAAAGVGNGNGNGEATEYDVLFRGKGEDAVGFRDVPAAEYGLTPEQIARIHALGEKAQAERQARKPVKPPRQDMLSEARKAAAEGVVPPRLVFKSDKNPSYQKHADAMFALALDRKLDELKAYPLKGTNTYARALQRWRDTAVPVVEALMAQDQAGALRLAQGAA